MKDEKKKKTDKTVKSAAALLLCCLYVPVALIGIARKIKSKKLYIIKGGANRPYNLRPATGLYSQVAVSLHRKDLCLMLYRRSVY